jgi:hypothetical protein
MEINWRTGHALLVSMARFHVIAGNSNGSFLSIPEKPVTGKIWKAPG